MREPDGWWGHLPVFTNNVPAKNPVTDLGIHMDWHRRQLAEALVIATDKYQGVLRVIPPTGFEVLAIRGKLKNDDEPTHYLVTGAELRESIEGIVYPKTVAQRYVSGTSKREALEILGSESNCFHELFDFIADDLPAKWAEYLKWRRRQPRKPVPQWLLDIRAKK